LTSEGVTNARIRTMVNEFQAETAQLRAEFKAEVSLGLRRAQASITGFPR
jgi:hypothetical protein